MSRDKKQNRHNSSGYFQAPILHSLPEEMREQAQKERFIGSFIHNSFSADEEIRVLEVQDRSFVKYGVFPGDLVMASREALPDAGDLVIASIGEETFLAVYYPQKDRIRLDRDENGHRLTIIDPMLPDFHLHGKVIHIFRKID